MLAADTIEDLDMAETETMAKAKAKQDDPGDDVVKTLFAVKGSLRWSKWLKEFADSLGTTSLGAIDESLRERAEARGFRPMPKRIPR